MPSQRQVVHGISAVSRVDSKGRVSIPIGLRYKLKLFEGSEVSFQVKGNKLVLFPVNGRSGVKASTEVCGASSSGSTPDSDPKKKVVKW